MTSSIHRGPYNYNVYGCSVRSYMPLAYPEASPDKSLPTIELVPGSASLFARARKLGGVLAEQDEISERVDVEDGSIYLRWFDHFEFLIVDGGTRICWRALNDSPTESLHYHLLGPVLSYAMLMHGIEPLHATALDLNGRAVGLLGQSGAGKSTLAAAFLNAGYKLLTDDVLVLTRGRTSWLAYPGLPRLKLYKDMARLMFGKVSGTAMNRWTTKEILPVPGDRHPNKAIPMHAFYILSRSDASAVLTRRCTGKRALIHLLRHTYNSMVTDPERLKRQLQFCTALATETPISFLFYPHKEKMLGAVVSRIIEEVNTGTYKTRHGSTEQLSQPFC